MLPGMGVDPAQLAAVQKVSKYIKGKIRIDYNEKSVSVSLSSDVQEAIDLLPELVGQLGTALATQLSSFFAIKGEIVEVGKPAKQE